MAKNATEVYGDGYIAGYNQCKVDRKEMTQAAADKVLHRLNKDK